MSPIDVAAVAGRLARLAKPGERVLVAVSGGPDSIALLALLAEGRAVHGRALTVGHVDHGIHPDSGDVAAAVEALSARFGLACLTRRLHLGAAASETSARRARRAALRELAAEVGAARIALAHHADDQIETVLLRVLRGTGAAGLAAMAPRRGPWIRPLLEWSASDLATFLASAGLSAWQDPANRDPRHDRSWVRTELLPLLEARFGDIRGRLGDLARHAARDRRGWNAIPGLLAGLDPRVSEGCVSVAAPPLLGYRSEVQHAVLAALGRRLGVPFGQRSVARVMQVVGGGKSGRLVRLPSGIEAELAFDRLEIRRPVAGAFPAVELPEEGSVTAGPHRFRAHLGSQAGAVERDGTRTALAPGRYAVRPWQAGDRVRPLGGTGSRPVAVLLREARVTAGRRAGWPVVTASGDATIVWVPGICRSGDRLPPEGKEALHVECDLA